MKVSVYLKPIKEPVNGQKLSYICFRVRDKAVDIKAVSELTVKDKYWDAGLQGYKRSTPIPSDRRKETARQIAGIIESIETSYDANTANGTWLKQVIEEALHPAEAYRRKHPELLTRLHEYIEKADVAKRTREHIADLERKMARYHLYRQEILGEADFHLYVETLSLDDMEDFRNYVANEYSLRMEHPDFYPKFPKSRNTAKELSSTTLINVMNQLCTFLHWCKRMKYTDSDVYLQYGCKSPVYGDPFFLTCEERNTLYDADLSGNPRLAVIRDIFVFQCYVGCRFGDLVRLTKENVKDGFIEYVPQKTKKCEAKTVRVPLHEKALSIVSRYAPNAPKLLPFRNIITYNKGIKELLRHCGINRTVTILDTHGYKTVQKPLYEVATSHTARKTFIGNLYKQVPDPNLIASMSGHVEGSRAFRRYRSIDDDMKRKLVEMID